MDVKTIVSETMGKGNISEVFDPIANKLIGKVLSPLGGIIGDVINLLRPPIGAFGDLVFEVSTDKVLTYDDYKRDNKARYAKHELINQKPALEYLGEDTEKISLTITLTTMLGVNPAEENAKVRQMCKDGYADYLIVGNEVIGDTLWVITDVTEKAVSWDTFGNMLVSTLDVTFESYTEEVVEE